MRKEVTKKLLLANVVIFSIVAIVHLLRVLAGWEVVFSSFTVPLWFSVIAVILAGTMSFMNYRNR